MRFVLTNRSPVRPDNVPETAAPALARAVIVSDDPNIRELESGFPAHVEVLMAWDAGDALALIRGTSPSLVIVDMRSGNAGGFSLTREMRQFPELDEIPVLILLEREQDGWLAEQAGATAHRVKPLETDDLVADALAVIGDR